MRPENQSSAVEAFRLVCEQIRDDFRELKLAPPDEFSLFGIPAWVAGGYTPFEVIDVLRLVVKGGTVVDENDPVHSSVLVLELEVTHIPNEKEVTEHSFMVTPLPSASFGGAFSIPHFFTWVFSDIGHSGPGSGGTGNQLRTESDKVIAEAGRIVKHKVECLKANPFEELFRESGPIVWVKYPSRPNPERVGFREDV
jgi:hypothetical protein